MVFSCSAGVIVLVAGGWFILACCRCNAVSTCLCFCDVMMTLWGLDLFQFLGRLSSLTSCGLHWPCLGAQLGVWFVSYVVAGGSFLLASWFVNLCCGIIL